jgi:ligand-binding sensor domain-containing protein/signal transduction histidine kinase
MSGIVPGRRARLLFAVLTAGCLVLTTTSRAATNSWTANLAVGTNIDGRLEVFDIGGNGDLRHRWQRESLHDWSAWSVLGGSFLPGVAVVNDAAGRLGVFAVDRATGIVMYNFQKEPNSPVWSSWASLPGQTVRAPLAAGQDVDGCLELFAVDAQVHSVKHIWQDLTRQAWSEWSDLGGSFEPGLVVARNKTGQLEVFGTDVHDRVLTHCWQAASNSPTAWTPWARLGEPLLPGFVIGQDRAGRLEVFGINAVDGFLAHGFQLTSTPDSSWSEWTSLRVKMKPVLSLGQTRDGRLEIFAVNPTNNMIYHSFATRTSASTNWGGWADMSLVGGQRSAELGKVAINTGRWTDVGGGTRSYPVLGKGMEGDMEIFAFDERLDDVLNYRRQISGNMLWTDWLGLDHVTSEYLSRAWRMDDGLPDNRVQAIGQTPDGYLWVGTRDGLARFDGARFVTYPVKTIFGLTNASISALCVDHDSGLWVGTESEGLARISGTHISRYTAGNGLAGDGITAIVEASDRSLWIGTTSGLSRYQGGRFKNYTTNDGLVWNNIRSILEDTTGGVWISTAHGLNRVKNNRIATFTSTNGLPVDSVTGLWQDVPARVWIASDQGLIFFRGGQFYAYDKRYGLTDRLTTAIRSDSQGNLWVGNNTGLSQFKDGRFSEQFDQEGNPFGKINALYYDHEGNLWAGSQDGLFRVTPKRLLLYGRRQQLTHDNITSVMEDNSGSLWIGTWGGGLDQLKNEMVTAYDPANGFHFDLISALANGHDGSIWVSGPSGSGLAQLKHGMVAYRTAPEELANAAVRVIHEDRSGLVWIGHNKGLACLEEHRFVTNSLTEKLTGTEVRALGEGPDGALWIGSEAGLSRWKDGQATSFTTKDGLSDARVTALYADTAQALWIGTRNGGLNRYLSGRFSSFTAADGLFSNEIFEILEDDFGWLWMSCSKGVFRVSKKNLDDFDARRIPALTSIVYGHDDGMESVLCGDGKPGAWKSRDGVLWFPTGNGLVAFDPRILKIDRTPPPVYVEDVIADHRSLTYPNALGQPGGLSFQTSFPMELRVPPGRGELEFHYTAITLQRPERSRFKYKLEGIDPEWIDAGTRRAAYYNNLSPGHYRFSVTACNSDGVWNDAGGSLALFLVPHVWQRWWFRALCASALTGLVAGTARQVTKRRMQRKLELLEQRHAIEKERLRIARDIHDDLGGSLTQIALLGELAIGTLANPAQAAGHLAKITNSARLNVRALDEIVWAVHPGNDSLNSLVLYLWQFAEEFFGASGVRCRVEAPPNIPPCPLASDLRHSIFLLVKEAFNNVVKHAQASAVKLRFAVTAAEVAISIEDNGGGFRVATVNGGGHGLANMRTRVQEIGGKIELTSVPGHGTRIEFILPLKIHHEVN